MRRKGQLARIGRPMRGAGRRLRAATLAAALALGGLAAATLPRAAAEAAEARNPKKQVVVIWKDFEAQNQARKLIDSGALKSNPDAVNSLVACIVPNGTQLTVVNWGQATDDVQVTSGPFKGCSGNVMKDYVDE